MSPASPLASHTISAYPSYSLCPCQPRSTPTSSYTLSISDPVDASPSIPTPLRSLCSSSADLAFNLPLSSLRLPFLPSIYHAALNG
ncbi:hypothetical protein SERLA73DRAFT_174342 [Serpula lacrymans var. lacrymans S7.3]|uniref:Uncharacterized protein n=1 Tax=Serpula lacrymans var. lacrymans (strain S7.3) TaxID=936435 RepID=F8PF78_SERL3|nr:hypothetical protein SERLA73DRAFT_174342 [Serpula lacrymans var. lacrymans S7.3]